MGRYYNTDSGRSGKFMFGVQSSGDPEVMGMREQAPTSVFYYADKEDVEEIRGSLDEQYDLLGVPTDERIYYAKDMAEYDKYENEHLADRVWITVREDNEAEMAKHKNEARWYSEKEGCVAFEIPGHALPLARIRLAINILSDIKDEGYCSLEAEL